MLLGTLGGLPGRLQGVLLDAFFGFMGVAPFTQSAWAPNPEIGVPETHSGLTNTDCGLADADRGLANSDGGLPNTDHGLADGDIG